MEANESPTDHHRFPPTFLIEKNKEADKQSAGPIAETFTITDILTGRIRQSLEVHLWMGGRA